MCTVRCRLRRVLAGIALPLVIAAAANGCGGLDAPPTTTTAADSADNVVWGVSHNLTEDGIRRVFLEADSAYFYADSEAWKLFEVTVTFFTPSGEERSRVTADSGGYVSRDGDMVVWGNVVAVTPDGRRLTTTELRYARRTDQIEGPEDFVFVTADGLRREGEAFTADPDFRNVVATRARGEVGRVEIDQ